MGPVGRLKPAEVGAFTPWELANAVNQGSFSRFPLLKCLPAHQSVCVCVCVCLSFFNLLSFLRTGSVSNFPFCLYRSEHITWQIFSGYLINVWQIKDRMKEGRVRIVVKIFTTNSIRLLTNILLISSSANHDKNGSFAVCCVTCWIYSDSVCSDPRSVKWPFEPPHSRKCIGLIWSLWSSPCSSLVAGWLGHSVWVLIPLFVKDACVHECGRGRVDRCHAGDFQAMLFSKYDSGYQNNFPLSPRNLRDVIHLPRLQTSPLAPSAPQPCKWAQSLVSRCLILFGLALLVSVEIGIINVHEINCPMDIFLIVWNVRLAEPSAPACWFLMTPNMS